MHLTFKRLRNLYHLHAELCFLFHSILLIYMGKRRRRLFCCRILSYSGGPEARSLALKHSTMSEVIVGNPGGGSLKKQKVERFFLSEKGGILTNLMVKCRKRHRKLPRNPKGQQDCRDIPWTGYNNDDKKMRNLESLKCSDI